MIQLHYVIHLKEIFQGKQVDYREVHSTSGSILSKIINMIYFLDYCSIYRAVLGRVDPSPIEAIDYIKKYTK